MVAKSIIKLLDEAIIPAAALIVAKMVGLFATAYIFNLAFEIKNASLLAVLPSVHFKNLDTYILAENYSNLAMFSIVAIGTLYVLVRAHFLHESHIRPSLHAKLANLRLDSLVTPSYHLYHQAVIWLIFLWLTVGFLLISTFILHITYPLTTAIAFIVAANFSWLFAIDIEKEIELSKS